MRLTIDKSKYLEFNILPLNKSSSMKLFCHFYINDEDWSRDRYYYSRIYRVSYTDKDCKQLAALLDAQRKKYPGIVKLTLNGAQSQIRKILTKSKCFVLANRFINPNTGSNIYVYQSA